MRVMSNYTYFYENKKSGEAEENVKRIILEKFRNGLNSRPVMEAIPVSQKHTENILDELEELLDKYTSLCKVPLNIQNESKSTKQNLDCKNISTRNMILQLLENKSIKSIEITETNMLVKFIGQKSKIFEKNMILQLLENKSIKSIEITETNMLVKFIGQKSEVFEKNSSKVEITLHNKNVSKRSPQLAESLTIMNDNTCFYEKKKSAKAPDYMRTFRILNMLWGIPVMDGLPFVALAIAAWKVGSSIGK